MKNEVCILSQSETPPALKASLSINRCSLSISTLCCFRLEHQRSSRSHLVRSVREVPGVVDHHILQIPGCREQAEHRSQGTPNVTCCSATISASGRCIFRATGQSALLCVCGQDGERIFMQPQVYSGES